jgi:hypothetical protein
MAFVAQDVRDLLDLANRSSCADVLFRMLESLRGNNDALELVNSSMNAVELNKVGIARAEKSNVRFMYLSLTLSNKMNQLMHLSKLIRTRLGMISEETVVRSSI